MNPLELLGFVQNSGGLLLVVVVLAVEMRYLRRDLQKHERDFHGVGHG